MGVTGTPFFFMSPMKYSFWRSSLNSELNGPQYEMNAVAREQFPTNLLFYSPISLAPFYHLSLSSVNEVISVLAVVIFFLVFTAWSSRIYFSLIDFLNFSLSSPINIFIMFNSIYDFSSSAFATLSFPSCTNKNAYLGLTILDFSWYS